MLSNALTYSLLANIILFLTIIYLYRRIKEQNSHYNDFLDRTHEQLRIAHRDFDEIKKKFDKRPNSRELDEFINDLAVSGKSLLEVKRVNSSNIFVWNK